MSLQSGSEGMLLEGLKILDFSALLPGPYGTALLADLGADVIKVEPPNGDTLRSFPFEMARVVNRNKRSIAIDLKNPASGEVIERLARWADIALEGSRPGVADRVGIGAERLRSINPKLVYCSISGFGQTGPWRNRSGHDVTYMAAAGALAYPGSYGETKVRRAGLPVSDLAGSLHFAVIALAAWARAQRTGQGAVIDLSLTEASMSLATVRGDLDRESPNLNYLMPGNDTFETADGRWVALGLIEPQFWTNFVEALGDEDPRLRDPHFSSIERRLQHGEELQNLLTETIARHDAAFWQRLFDTHDIPGAVIWTMYEAVRSEQALARDLIVTAEGQTHLPFPARLDGQRAGSLRWVAPNVGQHTDDVLRDLGFDDEQTSELKATGAFDVRSQGT